MTDEEFEELKTKFTKELERRKRLESALGDIEHIKNCKKDNPSIRVRNRTITLTETEKERVCDYIISVLKEGLEEYPTFPKLKDNTMIENCSNCALKDGCRNKLPFNAKCGMYEKEVEDE